MADSTGMRGNYTHDIRTHDVLAVVSDTIFHQLGKEPVVTDLVKGPTRDPEGSSSVSWIRPGKGFPSYLTTHQLTYYAFIIDINGVQQVAGYLRMRTSRR